MMMMMLRLLVAVGLMASGCIAKKNVQADFMRAMRDATQMERQESLHSTLLRAAVPRESLPRILADENYDASLNLTDYAVKYVGCQNIKSFSDDLAADEDSESVLGLNKFVVFRLCPADQCSSYNKYGCSSNFGEYVIEMEYYLQIMAEYHYQQYMTYCATCIECMSPPEGLDDDYVYQVYNETDDAVTYNATVNETVAWNPVNDCEYYMACENYERACKKYVAPVVNDDDANDDDANGQDLDNLVGCEEFQVGNTVGYLGPHCSDDGLTITIGIFQDDACTEYIGNEIDLAYYTGSAVDDSWLSFYSSPTCIACTNEDAYGLYNDDATGKAVYDMCEVLYDASGKCNRYLNVFDLDETYDSDQQEDTSLTVCNFVESLMENNYDEFGEVIVVSESFDVSNWKDVGEYQKDVAKITGGQIAGVVISSCLMLVMFVYSVVLYSQVKKAQAAKPSLYKPGGLFSRTPSGIMMMRSGSGSAASMSRKRSGQYHAPRTDSGSLSQGAYA